MEGESRDFQVTTKLDVRPSLLSTTVYAGIITGNLLNFKFLNRVNESLALTLSVSKSISKETLHHEITNYSNIKFLTRC